MSTTLVSPQSIQEQPKGAQKPQPQPQITPRATLRIPAAPVKKSRGRPGPKAGAQRPNKYLPTDRITFSKQLDILRGWAAASGPAGKVVTNNAVADIVKMQASTVSLANAFFVSSGLIVKTEGGSIPCPEVAAFLRAYEWSPETAAQKLAPILQKTWFAEELLSKLAFGPMTENEAVQDLADAAKAAPEYRGQLRILLDYLAAAGLIQRDGNQLKKGQVLGNGSSSAPIEAPTAPKSDASPSSQDSLQKSSVPILFGTTEGAVNFHVSVRVDMGEFANWKPERIAAFFTGIAQVLAAKANIEEQK